MLRLLARGKINWSLDILGLRGDGYHRMDMLMESVELADVLTLEPDDDLRLTATGCEGFAGEDNLVLRAARALKETAGCARGAALTLVKRIPVGAGMGGGSADAAAALVGLNRLWGLRLPTAQLEEIGARIGADVPFLVRGGLARVGGIGEAVRSLPSPPPVPLVVLQPCGALSTREVFAAYDTLPSVRHPDTDRAKEALLGRDLMVFGLHAGNVLAQAGEEKRPQIAEGVAALDACGARFAMMTGSGSAVFGAFANQSDAEEAYRILRRRWRKCWLTRTAAEGIVDAPADSVR